MHDLNETQSGDWISVDVSGKVEDINYNMIFISRCYASNTHYNGN